MITASTENPSLMSLEKYVPPPARRNLLQNPTSESYPRQQYQPRPPKRPDQNSSAYGHVRPGASRDVADRWKCLDDGPGGSGPSGSGLGGSGLGGRPRPREFGRRPESKTGTGWDVRDHRAWRPENLAEVFKKDKDKATGISFGDYDTIPVELTGDDNESIHPLASFQDARGVHALLMENITRVEYERPTPVQKYSIPAILAGRDLMACAQTGSGKTAAFLFPIITKLLMEGPPTVLYSRGSAYPVALILSPTRELAVQIHDESRKYAFHTGIRTVVVYGGGEVRNQLIELQAGCDICVATPGRLSDLLGRGKVALQAVRHFVLDEADRMLDMGFAPQITEIVDCYNLPTSVDGRQTVMFSATFPASIQNLARRFLRNYLFLTMGRLGSTNELIQQNFIYADENAKPPKLLKLLGESQGLVLVFVSTRKKADLITDFLNHRAKKAVTIHGDKSQVDRERALHDFRCGQRPILVATDVAARGLDIYNIEHVINCDLPTKIDDYIHRIGRTGRAGNRGKATSFINEDDRPILRDLLRVLRSANQEVPDWFISLVSASTSSSRGGGGYAFARRVGGGRSEAFSSRDTRQVNISRGPEKKSAPLPESDDDGDGWSS